MQATGFDTDGVAATLGRMDAFARRVGFAPTRLPAWLQIRPTGQAVPGPGFSFDWAELLPPLTLYLHLSVEDLTSAATAATAATARGGGAGGVVRWEGEGPVTHRFVHEWLRPLHRYLSTPVVDLAHQAPADAYEVPDRLRRAVHLRTPADTFPYSSHLSRRVDLDHTEPYPRAPAPRTRASRAERALATRTGNLAPLGRHTHRIKTHGRWTVRQPFEGIYLWRDPHGQLYLVDHTGTHPVTRPGHPAGPARGLDPATELVETDTLVHADFDDAG